MANAKITALTALAVAPATNDLVPIVDVSDTTDSANGTTKKITVANLFTAPTIADFTNMAHDHGDADDGGQLTDAALSSAIGIAKGGTGQTTATAAFDALAPTTTAGDMIYHNGSDNIRLAKGTAGQSLVMNAAATAPEWGVPTPFFYQRIGVPNISSDGLFGSSSSSDGSVLVTLLNGGTNTLIRFARDANTGVYIQTHSVNPTSNNDYSSVIILGSYVYLFDDNNTVVRCYRYDLATLANETLCTMPSIDTSGSNYQIATWTDGTFIYLVQNKASSTGYKLAISGTTLTTSSTSTTAAGIGDDISFMFDGTNIYSLRCDDGNLLIKKASDAFFAASTSTTKVIGWEIDVSTGALIIPIDTNRIYVGYQMDSYDETAVRKQIMVLIPITKP